MGLKEVAKLQKLEGLFLSNTQITDEGLKEVASVSSPLVHRASRRSFILNAELMF